MALDPRTTVELAEHVGQVLHEPAVLRALVSQITEQPPEVADHGANRVLELGDTSADGALWKLATQLLHVEQDRGQSLERAIVELSCQPRASPVLAAGLHRRSVVTNGRPRPLRPIPDHLAGRLDDPGDPRSARHRRHQTSTGHGDRPRPVAHGQTTTVAGTAMPTRWMLVTSLPASTRRRLGRRV